MRKYFFSLLLFQFVSCVMLVAQRRLIIDSAQESSNHDIDLSAWGPYSKRYAGISHVSDIKSGMRFDFTVCPGYYRNKILIPNVLFESSYSPWKVSPDMHQITYRYQLEWKDRVYADVTYYIIDSSQVLVEMKCVNNTDYIQNLSLNGLSFINYPDNYPEVTYQNDPFTKWINAVDYDSINVVTKPPQYRLVYNGYQLDEIRSGESLDGSLLAHDFGKEINDEVFYDLKNVKESGDGTLTFRYRVKQGDTARFRLEGLSNETLDFVGTGKFELKSVPIKFNGENKLALRSLSKTAIELDGFFITNPDHPDIPKITEQKKDFVPVMNGDNDSRKLLLKYKDDNSFYGMAWEYPNSEVREVLNDELDIFFRLNANNNVGKKFIGNGKGHFTNIFLRPVEVKPHNERRVYILLCSGSENEVKNELNDFDVVKLKSKIKEYKIDDAILPAGKKYEFGNQLMQAALLTNVVYPVYTQRQYIRHFTPGKWWNSLYTWDEGFISLGMSEVDIQKSFETVNAYTTAPGSQSAFIHHGSMVPVQFSAFLELWNKTQSKEMLQYMYPRLKQYYQFMVGETPTSTTRMPSNLLKTWDYFYNSGGWDDYPPQHYLREHNSLYKSVTPVITTAQCIRVAKIMRLCAEELGLRNDLKDYDTQIKLLTDALQKYSWDEKSGYFSYVVHDKNVMPERIFRYPEDSSNSNMGLDGVAPLVSDIATPAQQKQMIEKIFSPKHLWTPYGITAVDQSASYFRQDGYWNGTIWMPHQWFMWKALLDLGEGDKAYQIAHTALELWERETELTYNTFEHFISSSGRGAGWSQFSGLSSPVLNWFAAYYKIGQVTTGFETWIEKQGFNKDFSSYTATLSFDETSSYPHQRCMLICMNPNNKYEAYFDNKKLRIVSYHPGFVQIYIPESIKEGQLKIFIHKVK
ncbi:MAG TPA: trehalase family glycosidase [Chitinophagaceae bacterium]|nr:trehalase family glycosidase [Chitinophagaceae bacterium]